MNKKVAENIINIDGNSQLNGNMHCAPNNFILICIVIVIGRIYFDYALIGCLLFQKMILAYYFIKISIVSTVLSIILYYYNQTMKLYLENYLFYGFYHCCMNLYLVFINWNCVCRFRVYIVLSFDNHKIMINQEIFIKKWWLMLFSEVIGMIFMKLD